MFAKISWRKACLQMFFSENSLQSVVATELYIKKCKERKVRDVFKLKQQPMFANFTRRKAWLQMSFSSDVLGSSLFWMHKTNPLCFFRGAGEQAKASDIPQIEKRDSAVIEAQESESLTFSVRCIPYPPNKKSAKRMFWNLQRLESKRMSRIFRKVSGAKALFSKASKRMFWFFSEMIWLFPR